MNTSSPKAKKVVGLVLETLFSAKTVHRHPLLLIFHAIILSSVSIFVAQIIFKTGASQAALFFFAMGTIPLLETLLKHEEKIEAKHPKFAGTFLARHFNLIQAFAWIFIGLIISYAFWYSVLPAEMRNDLFSEQEKSLGDISRLKSNLIGGMFTANAACENNAICWAQIIFSNNMGVLGLGILLGLFFGAGAIWLIAWNASIIGVVIGKDILSLAASYGQFGFFNGVLAFLHGLFNGLGLVPHGLFEASAYFIGAIAGAILGIMATKRHYYRHELGTIVKDTALLVIVSILCIFIGAIIEAFVIVSSLG